ncbi:MAG: HAD family phosphatase [Anaerolineae bacterium]|nr:HAD family phosphatase [Anaerolineae bacterium]
MAIASATAYDAIIFDMDGLMLDTERLSHRAFHRAFDEMGYALPYEDYLRLVGRNRPDTEQLLAEMYGPQFPVQAIYQRTNIHYAAAIAQAVPVKSGLRPLLDWLTQNHIPIAVASSTERSGVEYKLRQANLRHYFPVIVGGNEVSQGKPKPDIFLTAAQRIQIAPHKCIVLEDSEPGIRAAHAANMLPIMIPDLKPPSAEIKALAHRIFPTLTEALPFVQSRLKTSITRI